jgi:DNA-binding transcriptional LysR family regulator
MDMRQVRHFLAVAEHGNIMRAADAIHISQPALSKSIQNLEAALGVRLFERTPRGVSPTIYGTRLLKHAKLLHNQAEQAVAEIRSVRDGHMGHLRLGVANFATYLLPRVIAKLLDVTPGLSFEIFDGTYEGLTAQLREGALDAVVSGFPPLGRSDDLVHEPLVSAEFVLACRPDHPLARRKRVSLAELADQRWILASRPHAVLDIFELAFRRAGVAPPKLLVRAESMLFLKAILLDGSFLTFLPRGVVAAELQTGQLIAIALDDPMAKTKEGIIYRAGAIHPPALFALIDAIKAEQRATAEGAGAVTSARPLRTPAPIPARRPHATRSRHLRARPRRPKR